MPSFLTNPSPLLVALGTIVAIGLLNGVKNLVSGWAKAIGAPVKPLSITLKTDKTPQEVIDAANAARNKRRLFWLAIAVGLWLAAWRWNPDVVEPLTMTFANFFISLFQIVGEALIDVGSQLSSLLA